jgi:ring-1,2-phenylacetyl-CoA epoxidase subunit PaaA
VGLDVSSLLSRPNRERYVNAFRGQITSWEEFAVFGFLIDRVGRYQLEEFIGGSYAPLDRILPEIIVEERGHIEYGHNQTAEFAARGGASKAKVQRVIDAWYPKALDMFGSSRSRRSERYRHWGLKRRTNAQAREEYIREVNPLIEALGLTVPDPHVGREFV